VQSGRFLRYRLYPLREIQPRPLVDHRCGSRFGTAGGNLLLADQRAVVRQSGGASLRSDVRYSGENCAVGFLVERRGERSRGGCDRARRCGRADGRKRDRVGTGEWGEIGFRGFTTSKSKSMSLSMVVGGVAAAAKKQTAESRREVHERDDGMCMSCNDTVRWYSTRRSRHPSSRRSLSLVSCAGAERKAQGGWGMASPQEQGGSGVLGRPAILGGMRGIRV
jgi:hypothetical protein